MGLVAGLAALMALGAGVVLLRRKRALTVTKLLDIVAIERLQDVVIPNGLDGDIQLEYVLLTVKGILVIDVKRFAGVVFAGEQIDEWTVAGKQRRFKFRNPLGALRDRVTAVSQVVPGAPVSGHVLFAAAQFGKDRPAEVLLPDELVKRYAKHELRDTERLTEAYWPHWERVCAVATQAESPSGGRI